MDVYRILHPTNITLPKTKDLRTTHTFIKLHHPKKTHSMKWSDWMSTTCKVDKNYKTKTNELCIVFVCVDACRCLRVLHSFFHFLFYDFTSVLCTFCCLLSILRHRPKHTNNVNKFQINYRRTSTRVVIESTGIQYYLERVITTGSRCHH